MPPVASLRLENLKKIANLDPGEFKDAFTQLPITSRNQTPLNQFLLELLEAYDEGCVLPTEVLACSEILARTLSDFDSQSTTYYLNLMQTVRRRRNLTDNEKNRLRDIAIDSEFIFEKAAAYALLGDIDMARRCRSHCSEIERSQIDNYPISIFFGESRD